MPERRIDLALLCLLILAITLCVALLFKVERLQQGERRIEYGLLEVASSLAEKGLPEEAAAEYERYLGRAELTDTERKNVLLSLGDLLMRDARDYRRALAAYTRLLALYPGLPIKDEVNAKIAECLARLGRTGEADRLVRKETAGGTAEAALEKKVARIGESFMTMKEFEERVERLPAPLRRPMKDRDSRLAMLHAVLQMEVVEREARALDLRNKKEFAVQREDFEKLLLRQFLFTERVLAGVKIDEQAVKYYYEAKRDLFREPSSYAATIHYAADVTGAVEIARHLAAKDGRAAEAATRVEKIEKPVSAAEIAKRAGIPYDLSAVLAGAKEGDAVGPLDTPQGARVLRIDEVRPGLLKPLEQVRPLVESRLLEEKQQEKLVEFFNTKFGEYGIKFYEEALE